MDKLLAEWLSAKRGDFLIGFIWESQDASKGISTQGHHSPYYRKERIIFIEISFFDSNLKPF